jgi:glycosyltransferase involved in cell wall biosynthesis
VKITNKRVIICSNYAWTIYNFRMALIRRLKSEGFEVCVLTQFDGYEKYISKEVDEIKSLFISRKGVNPLVDILTIFHFILHIMALRPSLLIFFSIKPVIYGSIAAKLMRIRSIVMITGLGTAFITDSWITKVVKTLYKFALSSVSTVFFQNHDDKNLFINQKLVDPKICRLVPGSGIDLERFAYSDLQNSSNVTFLLIARMLWDKGVGEFVNAARVVKEKYPNTRFQLLGPLGVENRTAIPILQMREWEKEGCIDYLGETDDVIDYIKRASCIVLPSYREGTSRVLLEASAVGRPLIATNVPGCREIIDDEINGFLCKPRDHISLARKIELILSCSHKSLVEMGIKGREKVNNEFHQDIVCDIFIDVINE